MSEQVSNRRVLYMYLLLGVLIVPSIGILGSTLAPREFPGGRQQTAFALYGVPAMFVAAGAAFAIYGAWRAPVYFQFEDELTVHYLFHDQVVRREEIAGVAARERSSTVGGGGTIPLTANDAVVRIQLVNGRQLSWGVSKNTGARFQATMQKWLYQTP